VTVEKVDEINNRASTTLRQLGFGAHETSVIVALNRSGSSTVADLSSLTGIHHANLYSILDSLSDRGLVISNDKRPRVYDFAPLNHLKDQLSTKVKQVVSDLKDLQKERTKTSSVPALIYTMKGSMEIEAKMLSMVERSENSILVVTPEMSLLGEIVYDALRIASERGVKIKIIHCPGDDEVDFEAEQRTKEDILAIDIVVDGNESLISMPDLSICGWADLPLISRQFEQFLDQTWDISKKVKR
jgi:sugar-specific transcriptional regulator TrmB